KHLLFSYFNLLWFFVLRFFFFLAKLTTKKYLMPE
ncbi:MAG: hypothetical protein ACJA0H_002234, partial [Francisellaceae bacterium]